MAQHVGEHAVVIGAGIGGLAAAAALSPHFARVTLIDKDSLNTDGEPRLGVGQGHHTHQLLKAGEEALNRLLPGLREALYNAGAPQIRVGIDIEMFDYAGQLPAVDTGFTVTAMSRPAYEAVMHERLAALGNVAVRDETPVGRLIVEKGVCTGVELADGEVVAADLVIDASGANAPLLQALMAEGHAAFETESVKINVSYTSAIFEKPQAWKGDCQGSFQSPRTGKFALLLPIEGDRWICSLGARGSAAVPRDREGFAAYAKDLPSSAIRDRIRDATPLTEFRTHRKLYAVRRRIAAAARWPERLLPLGDGLVSYNPTFGQGMTVAALQAATLSGLLAGRRDSGDLDGLGPYYLPRAEAIGEAAWKVALSVDYAFPETEGERPADFAHQQFTARVVRGLVDHDPELFLARVRMMHFLDDGAALREGPIAARIAAAIQAASAAMTPTPA